MAEDNQNGPTQKYNPDSSQSSANAGPSSDVAGQHPNRIGRYRIQKILGEGGFGLVYQAHDEQLDRLVAIKVPHAQLIEGPEDAEAYLAEARTVANLDHPGIVSVHDVGSTDDYPCYIVSKYVEGVDLASKLRQRRFKYPDSAKLVATVAEALHYAHKQGLVHRDVKPGNILISEDGQPFVVDFGLALREENIGKGPKYAGTPAYMSPEQARGEGHRVDGRSDIFSLGVVLYELLSGRPPFRGDTKAELLEQVTSYDPRPLRQFDETLPKELERICSKAMSKRASERYSSAYDLAEDLRLFLQEQTVVQSGTSPGGADPVASRTQSSTPVSIDVASVGGSPTSRGLGFADSQPIKIVPKGLRSFDAHDADFFLELLPGPRDREGLPDSLRFWKTRIEEVDPDHTFSVGLIYGPSGCGKSSLVKAGLLPRLSDDVVPVYIEATPDATDSRLLQALRKRCPVLEDNLNLKDTLATLRRGQGIPIGKKVLIVLDQFEQWLHAREEQENGDLIQALRQCHGGRVQCIVMVRDDFWMAATRFMRELEVRLVEAQNSAAVELFLVRHAEKVLAAFGRAFGTLPDNVSDATKEQKEFLKQSIAGLAEEGKVNCVRLALFAEMMKGKTWTPATLKEVGGTKGVGVTFLEETFSASTAPPEHRYHQKAARAVLKKLLPDSGTNIKGTMRSHAELLNASGYGSRPKDFDGLIRILDSETRLITPTDLEGKDADDDSVSQTEADQKYYQLTHDYLVHSLRDWLTRKQKETRKGRAELLLADRATVWNDRPESRQLPSLVQAIQIRWFTDKEHWTAPQRKMMSAAGRHQVLKGVVVAVLLAVGMFTGLTIRNQVVEQQNVTYASGLVDSLIKADIPQVPAIIEDMQAHRTRVEPLLKSKLSDATDGSSEKLHLMLALLPFDESQIDDLKEQLPVCTLPQFPVLRAALLPHKDNISETLWKVAQDESGEGPRRFLAAAALAEYAPDDEHWQSIAPFVAQYLTNGVSSIHLGQWLELLQPARNPLTEQLTAIHADRTRSEKQRETAALALARYLQDQPGRLVEVILWADELGEFSPLVETLRPHATSVRPQLLAEAQSPMPQALAKTNEQLSVEEQQRRDDHWKRQSLAAVTLVQLGFGDEVWPLLGFGADPSLRSFVIYHLGKLGTNHNTIASRLEAESDVPARMALLQSLGGLDASFISPMDRTRISQQIQTLFVNDPDPGIHSSASWTLQRWGEALPELSVGEPVMAAEQKQRIEGLIGEVKAIRARIAKVEEESPLRQAVWEQQLRDESNLSPPSLSEGLIAHYPLDESAGTEAANAIAGQPGGVYEGQGEPQWVLGVVGNALLLNGNGGHLNCGDAFNPERTDAFSYGCWFSTPFKKHPYFSMIANMDNRTSAFSGIDIQTEPDGTIGTHLMGNRFKFPLRSYVKVTSREQFTENFWHHVFVTYDGSSTARGVGLYIDGQPTATKVIVDSLSGEMRTPVQLRIGRRNVGKTFQGKIDDVRFYNRQLSDSEVSQVFKVGLNSLANIRAEQRTPEQQAVLTAAFPLHDELLTRLNSELSAAEVKLRDAHWEGIRRWYVNGQGQTMVIIPNPSQLSDSEVDYDYAIASHETTVAEFRRFREQFDFDQSISPTEDCPANVGWFDAAAYCNWLSAQEGIPEDQWVYEPNEEGDFHNGMTIKENFRELVGYRLPTEQEWRYSCSASARSSYAFGEVVSLLGRYAWNMANAEGRLNPVGTLLPNQYGLFDLHGNVSEFSQDTPDDSFSPVPQMSRRFAFGGAIDSMPSKLRVENTLWPSTGYRDLTIGFRVVRTMPLLEEVLQHRGKAQGDHHLDTVTVRQRLATAFETANDPVSAEVHHAAVIDAYRDLPPEEAAILFENALTEFQSRSGAMDPRHGPQAAAWAIDHYRAVGQYGYIDDEDARPAGIQSCLEFSGADSIVDLETLALDPQRGVTFEAWVRPTDFSRVDRWGDDFIFARTGEDFQTWINLRITSDANWAVHVEPRKSGNGAFIGAPGEELQEFKHIAAVVTTEKVSLYVNGTLVASQEISDGLLTDQWNVRIGGQFRRRFQGLIDEVRISNTVRYTEDFAPNREFASDDDTMALFHFDANPFGILVDHSKFQRHLLARSQFVLLPAPTQDATPAKVEPFTADYLTSLKNVDPLALPIPKPYTLE